MKLEFKFKCPWCGEYFESSTDLQHHARGHYVTYKNTAPS
ncbi:MAG: C2H2-type zinc finger protein [Methanocella sp.]